MVQPRRINLDEQALVASCTTAILADEAVTGLKLAPGAVGSDSISANSVTAVKLNSDVYGAGLTPNLSTNAIDINVDNVTLQIVTDVLKLKSVILENFASDPVAGTPGRLIWRTDLSQVRVDDGFSFSTIAGGGGSGHTIEDEGVALTDRATLNFIGAGVTVTDVGSKTQVSIPQDITALTGDVTASGSGSVVATIAANAVTNSKLAQVPTATFKGRTTAGTGNSEDLTISQAKSLLNLSGTNTGDQTITLTGEVTGSGTGSFATTIASGAIVPGKISTNPLDDFSFPNNVSVTGKLTTSTFRLTTSPTLGFVLTSDATGNGTWQSAPSGGHTIKDEGTPLTQRAVLNFVGTGVTVTDGGSETIVTIPSGSAASYAKDFKTVTAPIPDHTIVLSNTPLSGSEVVSLNGLLLRIGATNDYTISGNTLTINAGVTLTVNDEFMIVYAY